MTYYVVQGTSLIPTDNINRKVLDKLPAGNYTIKVDPRTNEMYLDSIDSFTVPSRLYGKTNAHAERIITTFNDRTSSTGVLLAGEKGSGKSLLAKMLSVRLADAGVPTIVINNPYCGEGFNAFIQKIDQPAVVQFDEFEKVYDKDQQEQMLTLLDGMYPTKKLFVLTCNDPYRVDSHMRNRPGRIFYSLKFKGLAEDEIREYARENLRNQANLEGLVRFGALFREFNFDMLKALVEEMNRYNENVQQAYQLLNTKPQDEEAPSLYTVSLFGPNGASLTVDEPRMWSGVPFDNDRYEVRDRLFVHYRVPKAPDELEEVLASVSNAEDAKRTALRVQRLKARGHNPNEGNDYDTEMVTFLANQFYPRLSLRGAQAFKNEDGFVVVFTPQATSYRSYDLAF